MLVDAVQLVTVYSAIQLVCVFVAWNSLYIYNSLLSLGTLVVALGL